MAEFYIPWTDQDERAGLAPPVTPQDAHLDEEAVAAGYPPEAMSSNQWPPPPPLGTPPYVMDKDWVWKDPMQSAGEKAKPLPPQNPLVKPMPIPKESIIRGRQTEKIAAKSPDSIDGPYVTTLSPIEEEMFQNWVKTNKVPWKDEQDSDYDMRGFWKALQNQDPRAKTAIDPTDKKLHYPDTWKTPYHKTFSNQSIYATRDAPKWKGDNLVDKSGKVIAGPGAANSSDPGTMDYYKGWANWLGFGSDSSVFKGLNFKNPETVKWFEDLKNRTMAQRKAMGLPAPDPKGPPPPLESFPDDPREGFSSPEKPYQSPNIISGTFPKQPTPQLNRDQEIAAALQQGAQYAGKQGMPPGKHQMLSYQEEKERVDAWRRYMKAMKPPAVGDQAYDAYGDPFVNELREPSTPIPTAPQSTGKAPFPQIPNYRPMPWDPGGDWGLDKKTPM